MTNDLRELVGIGENVLYEGKPDKKCFILESIFNPLLPVAIVWAIIDFGFIGAAVSANDSGMGFFIIPFFALHLMPVWLYLGGVLFAIRRYKNTSYIVTDRGVYISGGVFSRTYNHKPFAELSHVNLHRGIFDQMCNVGDIILTSNQFTEDNKSNSLSINSISNYTDVYNLVKKLQTDIYTDAMYPNDMRPPENHGYNTKYKG